MVNRRFFYTDLVSQFTSEIFIDLPKIKKIEISMYGKGRALGNLFIERLWRSANYENIYLNISSFITISDCINHWITNHQKSCIIVRIKTSITLRDVKTNILTLM